MNIFYPNKRSSNFQSKGFMNSIQNEYRKASTVYQRPYSPTILMNVLCLILQIYLYLEAFECNTTSDWLNHTV